jgi:hypothetical protein
MNSSAVELGLPPGVEFGAGWDACIASLGRPAVQEDIKTLIASGFHSRGYRRSPRILPGPTRALGLPLLADGISSGPAPSDT